jgi:hypothetical protein
MIIKINKEILLVLILCFYVTNLLAQTDRSKVGTTSGNILLMEIGARAIGMGGTYVGVADDNSALFWNPAGTSLITKPTVQYEFSKKYADIDHHFSGVSFPLTSSDYLGIMVQYLAVGEMEVTTIQKPEGTGEKFDVDNIVIALNYSRQLTDRVHVGLNIKYIYEKIWLESASNIAFDLGTVYNIDEMGLRLGMNILNLGTDMGISGGPHLTFYPETPNEYPGSPSPVSQISTGEYPLPVSFSVGISSTIVGRKSIGIKDPEHQFLLALSAMDSFDAPFRVNVGGEYGWNDIFFVRCGYRFFYDTQNLSLGFGLNFSQLANTNASIDYVWLDYGDLGSVSTIGLKINF